MSNFVKNIKIPNTLLVIFIGASLVVSAAASNSGFGGSSKQTVSKMTPAQTQQATLAEGSQSALQPAQKGNISAQSRAVGRAALPSSGDSTNAETKTPNSQQSSLVTTTAASAMASFTAQTLALHNKPGGCYVAYQGKVYDVSGQTAWSSCNYKGVSGGADVTSFFPQALSYFNSLPQVGFYSDTSTVVSNNSVTNSALNTNPTTAAVVSTTHFSVSGGGDDGSGDDNWRATSQPLSGSTAAPLVIYRGDGGGDD